MISIRFRYIRLYLTCCFGLIFGFFFHPNVFLASTPETMFYNQSSVDDVSGDESLFRKVFEIVPRNIWQTYKTTKLPVAAKKCQKTWLKNSSFTYRFCDDLEIERYIADNWDPAFLLFFKSLPLGVMKADLWRYMVVATEGGVYSDIDSQCISLLDKWSFPDCSNPEHVLILGLENDIDFCQWTFAATKNHPALIYVCHFLFENWKKNGIDISNPHFVHATTGPAIWTLALKSFLGVDSNLKSIQIYDQYVQDISFRKYINSKGVWLFPQKTFNGEWSCNLYGSQNFSNGYVKWISEKNNLQ